MMTGCWQHPVLRIVEPYESIVVGQPTVVLPYNANLRVLDAMRRSGEVEGVREYILWTLAHLNYPDHNEMTGTIYDFRIEADGSHTPLNTYDSVDSYSATFLMVVADYLALSGDRDLIARNWDKLADVAYTIAYLQESDGLTWARPDYHVKYLMDNCESYGGLNAFARLAQARGLTREAAYYERVARDIRNGIWNELYNPEARLFDWAVDPEFRQRSSWDTFYPDAYAQLMVIAYGLADQNLDLVAYLWTRFEKQYASNMQTAEVEQQITYRLAKRRIEGLGLLRSDPTTNDQVRDAVRGEGANP